MSLDSAEKIEIDARGMKFAVAASRFNGAYVDALLRDTLAELESMGAKPSDIRVARVPGAAELPYACNMLALSGGFDAVIALGVVIAGETPHHMVIAHSTAIALQAVAANLKIPAINGIIVANTEAQARARTLGGIKRGAEFARAAAEMAAFAKNTARQPNGN